MNEIVDRINKFMRCAAIQDRARKKAFDEAVLTGKPVKFGDSTIYPPGKDGHVTIGVGGGVDKLEDK